MKKSILACSAIGVCASAVIAGQKPNVLFIAVDDMKPLLGCYGNKEILSPNIDKLAETGMLFLNNSCQQAVCGPSRASLLTGCYPDTTKIYDLHTLIRDKTPDILTIPEYFKQQGYETTGVGKIFDPRSVGPKFDERSWSLPFKQNGDPEFFAKDLPPRTGEYRDPEVAKAAKALKDYLKEHNITRKNRKAYQKALQLFPMAHPISECMDMPDNAYPDGAFAAEAVVQMEKLAKGDKPFFLAVGFRKPHLPFVAPKKYWDMYDPAKIKLAPFQKPPKGAPAYAYQNSWELRSYTGIPPDPAPIPPETQRRLLHGYRACVTYTDTQIGKVLKKLDELGLRDKTIIILWGDHGWHLGDHGMFCKHTNYEQAVRAPMIISYPGQKPVNVKTESPTEFVDIFPTLCVLTGLQIPPTCEGKSLLPILKDPNASIREAGLEQFPRGKNKMGYTLRDKRYRYVKWVKMDYYHGERTGPTIARELYDYQKDPLEKVNLADNPEYKEVVEKFERLFKKRGVAQEH